MDVRLTAKHSEFPLRRRYRYLPSIYVPRNIRISAEGTCLFVSEISGSLKEKKMFKFRYVGAICIAIK